MKRLSVLVLAAAAAVSIIIFGVKIPADMANGSCSPSTTTQRACTHPILLVGSRLGREVDPLTANSLSPGKGWGQ
jgi:hypothetical protein